VSADSALSFMPSCNQPEMEQGRHAG